MPKQISLQVSPRQAADEKFCVTLAARKAGVSDKDVALARVVKRSVDARKTPKVNLTVEIYVDTEPVPEPVRFEYGDVAHKTPVVIVGGGPAGLFCALRLIELGWRPIVLERGKEVVERGKDIARLNRNEGVNPESNYAFGEGGAGTFSDGKLFTRSKKRGDYDRALRTLVFHGASEEILYQAHPHIGTDKLPRIMTAIRETIRRSGGSVVFGARVTDIEIRDGRAKGVRILRQAQEPETSRQVTELAELVEGAAVVLATGHSARDVYEILHARGVALEAKPFAMGVRIEHPQRLIDEIQYHGHTEWLPAASYSLVTQVGGRGVYSFCMCPGGFIVPAMTAGDESVVNGMSASLRNSPYANSGIVTEVRVEDFAHLAGEFGPLAGLEFQRRLEKTAAKEARSQCPGEGGGKRVAVDGARHLFSAIAPAQRVADFVSARPSPLLPGSSYVPGLAASRLDEWLPGFMSGALRSGIGEFGRRMRGFVTNEGVVVGVESRTSTPVRIPRDGESLQHPQVEGLYPAGEGAGYAGGIISAALDGTRIAEAVFREKL